MSATGIGTEDVITVACFMAVVVGALAWDTVRHTMRNSPHARSRQRAIDLIEPTKPASLDVAKKADTEETKAPPPPLLASINRIVDHFWHGTQEKAGPMGPVIVLAVIIAGMAALASPLVFFRQPGWMYPVAALLGGSLAGTICLSVMTSRFKQRFLDSFPDALDLMIRAVQAGVPVVQVIQMAGEELPAPLGREFRRMGDALRLGMDPQVVLDNTAKRVDLPDFSFFVVCLRLQRETGGPLSETLENLASIIRSRRDTRLKTRALTAEGRASTKVIAAVPIMMVGAMEAMGSSYLDVLYTTESGQKMLLVAIGLIAVGIFVIQMMTRLEA